VCSGAEDSHRTSGKDVGVLEEGGRLILGRQFWRFVELPVDAQIRIVPANAALGRRVVVVGGLVEEFGEFAQHHEAVGETFRYPQLAMVVGGQAHGDPLAEMRRAATDIHSDIEDFASGNADQFALGIFQLVMQPAQHAFLRARMVVLDKLRVEAGGVLKGLGIETFVKEPALITKHLGFDDQDTRQVSGDYIHGDIPVAGLNGRHSCAKCRWVREGHANPPASQPVRGRMVWGLLIA